MILEKCLILEIVPAGGGPFLHYFKAYAAVPKNQRAATPDPEEGAFRMYLSGYIKSV